MFVQGVEGFELHIGIAGGAAVSEQRVKTFRHFLGVEELELQLKAIISAQLPGEIGSAMTFGVSDEITRGKGDMLRKRANTFGLLVVSGRTGYANATVVESGFWNWRRVKRMVSPDLLPDLLFKKRSQPQTSERSQRVRTTDTTCCTLASLIPCSKHFQEEIRRHWWGGHDTKSTEKSASFVAVKR